MKRSGPPRRRKPLRADSERTRAWKDRSRKPLPARSKRRRAELQERHQVRLTVIARDKGCAARGIPGVPHGAIGGRAPLEVHELKRGAHRSEVYLDPDWCLALCPASHDWVTENPQAAIEAGLALPGWAGPEELAEAKRIRDEVRDERLDP